MCHCAPRNCSYIIFLCYFCNSHYTEWGKCRFMVVSVQNTEYYCIKLLYYSVLIIVLFSIQTTVSLLLPHHVYIYKHATILYIVYCNFLFTWQYISDIFSCQHIQTYLTIFCRYVLGYL